MDQPDMNDAGQPMPAAGFAPLTFDVEAYLPGIAEVDFTEAQGRELLGALWAIMVSFVDLGLGIAPVRHAREAVHETPNSLSGDSAAALASIQSVASQFSTSAAQLASAQERKES